MSSSQEPWQRPIGSGHHRRTSSISLGSSSKTPFTGPLYPGAPEFKPQRERLGIQPGLPTVDELGEGSSNISYSDAQVLPWLSSDHPEPNSQAPEPIDTLKPYKPVVSGFMLNSFNTPTKTGSGSAISLHTPESIWLNTPNDTVKNMRASGIMRSGSLSSQATPFQLTPTCDEVNTQRRLPAPGSILESNGSMVGTPLSHAQRKLDQSDFTFPQLSSTSQQSPGTFAPAPERVLFPGLGTACSPWSTFTDINQDQDRTAAILGKRKDVTIAKATGFSPINIGISGRNGLFGQSSHQMVNSGNATNLDMSVNVRDHQKTTSLGSIDANYGSFQHFDMIAGKSKQNFWSPNTQQPWKSNAGYPDKAVQDGIPVYNKAADPHLYSIRLASGQFPSREVDRSPSQSSGHQGSSSSSSHRHDSASTIPSTESLSSAKLLANIIRYGNQAESTYRNGQSQSGSSRRRLSLPTMPRPDPEAVPRVGSPSIQEINDRLVQLFLEKEPNYTELTTCMPFVERARFHTPVNNGVVKISNFPYATLKEEFVRIIGDQIPFAKMPTDSTYQAVHIMVERRSGRTNDCYIEFPDFDTAANVVYRLKNTQRLNLNGRKLEIVQVGQKELMEKLFPTAKSVRFEGCRPIVLENEDVFSSGFQGFVQDEELVSLIKLAENPNRSRFPMSRPSRIYEAMISLVFKFPWSEVDLYTLDHRNLIFNALRKQIATLADLVTRTNADSNINDDLLTQLVETGLQCPGFSEMQRAQLIDAANGISGFHTYVWQLMPFWPFLVLGCKATATDQQIKYYASVFKMVTKPSTLADHSTPHGQRWNQSPFGNVIVPYPANVGDMTIGDIAKLEWDVVENLLVTFSERET